MLDFKYHVETGPDGIRWVSLEPLMDDIVGAIDGLMKLDVTELDEQGKHVIDMKIVALRTVHEFLGSIITADNLKKIKQTHETEETQIIH